MAECSRVGRAPRVDTAIFCTFESALSTKADDDATVSLMDDFREKMMAYNRLIERLPKTYSKDR